MSTTEDVGTTVEPPACKECGGSGLSTYARWGCCEPGDEVNCLACHGGGYEIGYNASLLASVPVEDEGWGGFLVTSRYREVVVG